MPNNQSESEKVVNTSKKWGAKLLRNKLLLTVLIIVLVIILLVACLKIVLKNDVADKSSKIKEQQNKEIYTEYEIC